MTPLTAITPELAGQIAASYLHEPIEAVIPIIEKGSVNQIFHAKSKNFEVIVRMRSGNTAFQDYKKEQWCIEQARAIDIPGPAVLEVGKLLDNAYMLQTFIPGDNGEDSNLDKKEIWWKLGQYAKSIHTINIKTYRNNLTEIQNTCSQVPTMDNFEISWSKFVNYNIASLTEKDELIELKVLTKSQSSKVRKIFEELKDRKYNFGLNHRDLQLRNTIVGKSGDIYLLDWGEAEINIVPHGELVQLLKEQLLQNTPNDIELDAFLAGYGIALVEFEKMRPEIESLLLLRAFDTVRWAIDRCPTQLSNLVTTAKKILQKRLAI